ncbi:MAG: hypothetical protein H0S79_10400 [Anaerolineaceae bacterium]|nr:hypothetical protein [Anaerolineaceae bacterium]
MKKRIPLLLLLSLASLLLLSGCVNLVQEVTVHEDGSGSMRVALGIEESTYEYAHELIPEGYELTNILSSLSLDDYATGTTADHYTEGGSVWDSVVVDFSDMMAVFGDQRSFGPIALRITETDGEYSFTEEIDVANSNLAIPGIHLMDLTGAGVTVRLNTPQIIRTTGIQDAAGVSSWDVSVLDLIEEGNMITLSADYVLEPYVGTFIPWEKYFPYAVAGFLGVGVLAILVIVIVNTTDIGKRDKKKLNIH